MNHEVWIHYLAMESIKLPRSFAQISPSETWSSRSHHCCGRIKSPQYDSWFTQHIHIWRIYDGIQEVTPMVNGWVFNRYRFDLRNIIHGIRYPPPPLPPAYMTRNLGYKNIGNRFANHTALSHDDVIKWKHFPRYWPLWGESIGHRWILSQRAVARSCDVFFDLHPNKRFGKNQDASDLRRTGAHYYVTVITEITDGHINATALRQLTRRDPDCIYGTWLYKVYTWKKTLRGK